jgi:site-specific DNA-methyltransferase (adenine-specific)
MFTAQLMMSNRKLWKYNLIWDKVLASGFLNANRMPMRVHEDICVFYKKQPTYNPQKTLGDSKNHSKGKMLPVDDAGTNYGYAQRVDNAETLGNMKHPKSILTFSKPHPSTNIHPTQKSLELCEWLIKSYTNEGDTILDPCSGSGTTAVAALNTSRNFICIEKESEYVQLSRQRLDSVKQEVTNGQPISYHSSMPQ